MTAPDARLLRVPEVCRRLGCSRTTLFRIAKAGRLRPVRLSSKLVGYLESDVCAFLSAHTEPPKAAA